MLIPRPGPTRVAGLTAYLAASVACAAVAFSAKHSKEGNRTLVRLAALCALIEIALSFDLVFNLRWALHRFLEKQFLAHRLYDSRRPLQIVLLALLALALLIAVRLIAHLFSQSPQLQSRWATLAAASVLLSAALWATEVISLHEIDRVLYAHVFGLMAIAWLWGLLSAITIAGMLLQLRALKRV